MSLALRPRVGVPAPAPGVVRLPRWRTRDGLVALLVCTALAALFAVGVWTHPGSRWLGYAGDPQQTTWFLRWTPHALTHGQNPLLTDHIAYPGGANLMWNTPVMLIGVLLAPVTLTLGPVVAYNLAVVLAFALSGFAAYLALRRLVGPGGAALAGALLFEFSPYTTGHALGQLNLTVAVAPPLALLLLHEILVRRRWSGRRAGLSLGFLATGQAFVSEEMLASLGVACLVFAGVLVAVATDRSELRERLPHALRSLAWSLAVFLPLMAWPLAVQFGGAQALHGAVQQPGFFVSDLLNVVVPTQSQLLAPGAAVDFTQRFTGNPVEWSAYLGLPLLIALGVVAWRRWNDRSVRIATICGAVFLLLSLGPNLHVAGHDTGVPLPWRVIEHVPLLSDMLPGRMTVYVDLCAALLLAVAVTRVRNRSALALAAVAVTVLPAFPLPSDTVPEPAFFTSAAVQQLPQSGSVLVLPFTTDFTGTAPMVWQAASGMAYRMPGGYAMIPDQGGITHLGPPPTPLSTALQDIAAGKPTPSLTSTTRAQFAHDLHVWDVRAALVGPMPHRDVAVSFLADLLGCAPQSSGGVDVWWRAGCS